MPTVTRKNRERFDYEFGRVIFAKNHCWIRGQELSMVYLSDKMQPDGRNAIYSNLAPAVLFRGRIIEFGD